MNAPRAHRQPSPTHEPDEARDPALGELLVCPPVLRHARDFAMRGQDTERDLARANAPILAARCSRESFSRWPIASSFHHTPGPRDALTRLVAGSVLDYPFGTVDRFWGFVIMTVIFLEPLLVALWIAVGSGRQRRSHFWVRFLLAALGLPALMAALVGVAWLNVLPDGAAPGLLTLLFLLGVIALMFVPGLLNRRSDSSPGPSESDGGGGGPGPPRPLLDGPRGGVPLPDADQAHARARDHHTPKLADRKRRRPAHEPRRTPAATNG